jgi:hypothetical protein
MSTQLKLLILAFEAALYPTLLAAVLILIAQPHPKRMLGAYLAGALIMSITAGCVIVFALGGTVDSSSSAVSWGADLAVGGLVLLVAAVLATNADVRLRERRRARRGERAPRHVRSDREPWTDRILARGSVSLVLLAGVVINVPGAAYLIGLKDIGAAKLSVAHSVLLILEFNLIMFLLAEIPLVGLVVAPESTGDRVKGVNLWLIDHSRRIAIAVCLAISGYLIARGVTTAAG